MTPSDNSSKHEDLVAQDFSESAAPNPFAHTSIISISVPETVEVKLVDASVLADYEIWSLVTSILGSAVVGFLVAFFQSEPECKLVYGAISVIFFILLIISSIMAIYKRKALAKKSKMSPLRKALSMAGEGICPDSKEGKPNYTWLYSKVFLTKLFGAKIKPGAELAFRRGLKEAKI